MVVGLVASLWGCVVYEPAPVYAPVASVFERAWAAALGAAEDVGVRVASADRAAGMIRGTKDDLDVAVSVRAQAGGSVRVEFNAKGPKGQDLAVAEQMSRAYDRRMGR
jgi:hypothetical protein